jgi:preprotein translocase subunit SecB
MVENTTPSEKAPAPSFAIKGQYVKDISFESPNAPQSLMATNYAPKIEVNVELKAQKLQENIFETVLHLTARASNEEMPLFLADLAYAGIFEISNVPQEHIEPLIMIDCPFVLFPFARRVIADLTRDGGFPPLMLDPIDFHTLYIQNKARA